jgi:DNA recombination protein RmuC
MGQVTLAVLCLIAGAAAGYAIAYFATRDRVRADSEAKIAAAESRAGAAEVGCAAAKASLAEVRAASQKASSELSETRKQFQEEQALRTKAETELEGERLRLQEERKLLDQAQQKLTAAFGDLAGQALRSNTESFLKIATEKLGAVKTETAGELEQRKQAVEALVKPIAESLYRFNEQIHAIEKARGEAYGSISQQVESLVAGQKELAAQTSNLVGALKAPKARGNWGEMQLRRVVELAGMTNYCDFSEQVSVTTDDDRRLRPDLIVNLPGGKQVVVDAKAPLKAYLDALEAPDEATRATYLRDHAKQVGEHIKNLSSKSYWEQFKTAPDFVVMFLPGETFFSAALEQDPSLIEQGVNQSVIVASPTTLIALLRAVAYGWRQEKIAESAKEISQLGSDLYERLRVMGDHFESVGANLNSAVKAFNAAVNSMESRVFPAARKFTSLGATAKKEIPELAPVEEEAHGLHARDWSRGLSIAASSEEPVHAKADAPGQED